MTHFNHEWNAGVGTTPAIPVAVGDRYYAQDLNDDFNYLKHLPYEVFLQGRSRGVMVAPSDTWNDGANTLTLSGGFGIILQDNICLDPDQSFTIPPKTKSSPRYERIPFVDTTLAIPSDSSIHYIIATPTKRSLLQRTKTILTEQYASRIRYDGVITIQNTAPTAGQILIGLCGSKEYLLLVDNNPNQCKDSFILQKWYAKSQIHYSAMVSALQQYYSVGIDYITTDIKLGAVSNDGTVGGIDGGMYKNCTISITQVAYGVGIHRGTFYNCNIRIGTVLETGIEGSTFYNCDIDIDTVSGDDHCGLKYAILNRCTVKLGTVEYYAVGVVAERAKDCIINIDFIDNYGNGVDGVFENCIVHITNVGNTNASPETQGYVGAGTFYNCTIVIDTIYGAGLSSSTLYNCVVKIIHLDGTFFSSSNLFNCVVDVDAIYAGSISVQTTHDNCTLTVGNIYSGRLVDNQPQTKLYLTRIVCASVSTSDINNVSGRLCVLNDTIILAS